MKPPSIQKVTSRGQVTLPITWRRKFKTDHITVKETKDGLLIRPAVIDDAQEEYTVFDAIRDNEGKGIKAKDLVALLKKIK